MVSRRKFAQFIALGLPFGASLSATAFAAPAQGASAAQAWEQFKLKHVKSDGRVVDKANGGISHTEGQGVALLAAATLGDKPAFESVLKFTQKLRRPDGLYSWKCDSKGQVLDINNASDGDLYIAWALARAYKQFREPAYLQMATALAQSIRNNCIVQALHGTVLLPGKDGFVKKIDEKQVPILNPAYWVFPAMNELNQIDPSPLWNACSKTGLDILMYAKYGRYGLPADWLIMTDPVIPWRDRPARFGYDAIRVPLFLYWGGYQKHPTLKAFAQFARSPGFPAWVALDDKDQAKYNAPPGFEAVAQLARKSYYLTAPALPPIDDDYFSASLTLLAHLAIVAN